MPEIPPPVILIIDDEKLIRASLARTLRGCGAPLVYAESGESAIRQMAEQKPGIILCDQRMPNMDGWEVLTRSHELCPDAIRIMLTGYTDIDSVMRAVNEGKIHHFMCKPWDDDELRNVVREAIDASRHARSAHFSNKQTEAQRNDLLNWSATLEEIVNSRTEALVSAYEETLFALVNTLDMREQATAGHSRRVALLTLFLALRLEIDPEGLEDIYRGALLHDFGKIGVADSILLKPGRLDEAERAMIEKHVTIGEGIIDSIGYLAGARPIIRWHHERYDGTGYPDGLAGEDIPLPARIFAVIDVYDALRSERPYKQAMTHEEACDLIREERGKHFDPGVIDSFLSIPKALFEFLCIASESGRTYAGALTVCGRGMAIEDSSAAA